MKRLKMLLTIGTLVLLISGISAVSAQAEGTNDPWYGPMYRWMDEHMGNFGNSHMGDYGYDHMQDYESASDACSDYHYGDNSTNNAQNLTVETKEEAYAIAQDNISEDVSIDNIYQSGKWWIVYYTDADGVIYQERIDAYTGEVVTGSDESYERTGGYYHGMMK